MMEHDKECSKGKCSSFLSSTKVPFFRGSIVCKLAKVLVASVQFKFIKTFNHLWQVDEEV